MSQKNRHLIVQTVQFTHTYMHTYTHTSPTPIHIHTMRLEGTSSLKQSEDSPLVGRPLNTSSGVGSLSGVAFCWGAQWLASNRCGSWVIGVTPINGLSLFNAQFGQSRETRIVYFCAMATRPQGPNALAHPSGRVWASKEWPAERFSCQATLGRAILVLAMFRLLQLLSWEIFSPTRNENMQFFGRNKIEMIVENCASMYDLNWHIS